MTKVRVRKSRFKFIIENMRLVIVERLFLFYFFLGSGFSFIKSLSYASILGVEQFGYYSLIILGQVLATYITTLGFTEGLVRYLISSYTAGEICRGEKARNEVISLILIVTTFVALIFIFCINISSSLHAIPLMYLYSIIPLTLSNSLFNIALIEIRAKKKLDLFARLNCIRSCLLFVGGTVSALYWRNSFYIVLFESVMNAVCFFGVVILYMPNFDWKFKVSSDVKKIIKVGFAFNLSSCVRNLSNNLDRWFVSVVYSVSMLGCYSFAMLQVTAASLMTTMTGVLIEGKYISDLEKGRGKEEIVKNSLFLSIKIGLLFGVFFLIFSCFLSICIQYFKKEYFPALHLLPFSAISAVLLIANIFDHVLLAFGKGGKLFLLQTVNFSLLFLCCCVFTNNGSGVHCFIIATICSRIFMLIMTFHLCKRAATSSIEAGAGRLI